MAAGKTDKLTIHLSDEAALKAVKVILAYESGVRGRTVGQVCSDMVMEAADLDAYPQEVLDRLDEIAEESKRKAVAKSLEMSE